MNTNYRRLIGWATLATIVVLALSAGIASANGDTWNPKPTPTTTTEPTPTTTEPAPTTTEPVVSIADPPVPAPPTTIEYSEPDPAYFTDLGAYCVWYVSTYARVPAQCEPFLDLFDPCGSSGTRRWSVQPCVYDIGEPQIIDTTTTAAAGVVLPATGNDSTLALIAVLLLSLGALCLVVRGIDRDMDKDVSL